jgi:DNA-binding SARP family transcriptional activator
VERHLPAQAKTYLRKALWQLQAAVDAQPTRSNSPALLVEPDWVQINPDADLWLDVDVFEQAFIRVQNVPIVKK